jgi:large subunit ribosomal protein L31
MARIDTRRHRHHRRPHRRGIERRRPHRSARYAGAELHGGGASGIKPLLSRSSTMKDGIHPDYHDITIVMTDGTTYQTRSTYGKAGDTLRLEIDSKSHPAWTGGQQRLLDTGGQLARFNKRFSGVGLKK